MKLNRLLTSNGKQGIPGLTANVQAMKIMINSGEAKVSEYMEVFNNLQKAIYEGPGQQGLRDINSRNVTPITFDMKENFDRLLRAAPTVKESPTIPKPGN